MNHEYDQIQGAAVHEAGHAIVAAALGFKVRSVEVDGAGFGEIRYRWDFSLGFDIRTLRRSDLMISVAGACAELLIAGREAECRVFFDCALRLATDELEMAGVLEDLAEDIGGHDDTLSVARSLVSELKDEQGSDNFNHLLSSAIEETLTILRESRTALERMAGALLERGAIDGSAANILSAPARQLSKVKVVEGAGSVR